MNANPVISNEKDAQKALIKNFLVILDEMGQAIKANPHALKAILSQVLVNTRFAYKEFEVLAPRIASFIGSTNDMSFLKSDMGYSRWIAFEIAGTKFLGPAEEEIRNKALRQAYFLWKADPRGGELTKEDLEDLSQQASHFKESVPEQELLQQYISSSTKEEGEFMTTTDILLYLQNRVGADLRLNTKKLGAALREMGFEKLKIGSSSKSQRYGYWISKNTTIC